jgi:intracellular septation protein A
MLREAAPRLLRDALGPLLAFYLGWKLVGLAVGVVAALTIGLLAVLAARREGRPGAIVRLVLAIVLVRATVGLIGHSTTVYFAQDVALDTALGTAMLGSLALGRPLAAVFAADVYEFSPEMRAAPAYQEVFTRITAAWGAFFLVRAAIRVVVLATSSTDAYVLAAAILDAPGLLAMMAWSISYSVRAFRRTPEWAALFGAP